MSHGHGLVYIYEGVVVNHHNIFMIKLILPVLTLDKKRNLIDMPLVVYWSPRLSKQVPRTLVQGQSYIDLMLFSAQSRFDRKSRITELGQFE